MTSCSSPSPATSSPKRRRCCPMRRAHRTSRTTSQCYNGRRILITFRRFEYTRNNAPVLDSQRRRGPYRQNNGTRQDARGLFSGLTTNARGDQCAARAAAPLHPWARKMADPAGLLRENTADQLLHTEKGLVDVTPVGQALWRRPMPRTRRKAPESECSSLRCLTRLLRRACARALPTSAMSNQEPPNRVWTTGRAWAPIKAIKG
jgi:hypothetical protein